MMKKRMPMPMAEMKSESLRPSVSTRKKTKMVPGKERAEVGRLHLQRERTEPLTLREECLHMRQDRGMKRCMACGALTE